MDVILRRPAVEDQRGWVEDGGEPGVFAHAVFRAEDEFAVGVIAAGFAGFAVHDGVDPAAAEERGEQVASGVGDVEQADDEGGVVVWGGGEGRLDADVEDVQRAKGYAGVVDGECDGRILQPGKDFERVDEDLAHVG